MRVGVSTFITAETNTGEAAIGPAELGRALEDRGFESLFTAEHTHVPVDETRDSDFAPRYHSYLLDPFVALTAVATATERLAVATGITLLAQRDPITLAKEVASLDLISGGRVILGIGAGWSRQEAANHGVEPAARFAVMAEHLAVLRHIWTSEVSEFHGEHVSFTPMCSYPKPVQTPHPPVLLGGWGRNVYRRLIDLEVGWMTPPTWTVDEAAARITEARRFAEEAGKPAPAITMFVPSVDVATLAAAEELAPERLLLFLEPANRDDTLRQLDDWAVAFAGGVDTCVSSSG